MKFTIFYNTGQSEVIDGINYDKALAKHGIYNKAQANIMFYVDGNAKTKYKWDNKSRTWKARLIKQTY